MHRVFTLFALLALSLLAQETTPVPGAPNTSARRGQPQAGNTPPASVSKVPIRSLLYPGATTQIYVRWMPWFGDEHHLDIGYKSDDPAQIDRQVQDMKSRGIDGAIVDWYGPQQSFKNRATERLITAAAQQGLGVAISEDSGALKECASGRCDLTGKLISDLTYVIEHFAASPAYIHIDGRPLITFFGLEKYNIDWSAVRRKVAGNPLFLFRNSGGFQQPSSDGAYSWIAPETANPSDPSALRYLEHFYEKASQNNGKLTMGSAYKGFNDSLAGWGKGRVIDQRCGQTWLDTFAVANRFYSSHHQLPALIIPTWNDYEEGTEIESGIDNCVRITAELDGSTLRWRFDGPASTIDHFSVVLLHGDSVIQQLEIPGKERSADLDRMQLQPGEYVVQVTAIGKPSVVNQSSNHVRYVRNAR